MGRSFDNLGGLAAAWLAACALSLGGWALLGGTQPEHERLARASALASSEIADALARRSADLGPLARATLVREDVGFLWLRVRDADGYALAAAGRLEPAAGEPALRGLRRVAYDLLGSEHRVPIEHNGRTVGSLEFGLMRGSFGATALGLPALLLGLPALFFLSLRLGRMFLREWRAAGPATAVEAAVLQRAPPRPQVPTAPTVPAPSSVALELLEAFDHGAMLIGRDHRVLDLNAPAARLVGRARERIRGQPLADVLPLFHADLSQPVALPLDACFSGTLGDFRGSYYLRLAAAPVREIECSLGLARDEGGRIRGVLLSIAEPTRPAPATRVVAEAPPLQAPTSRALLDQVLENVITADSQDRIHFANARALESLGYTLTELRGQPIGRLLPEPFLRRPGARLSDYIAAKGGHAATVRRRDGSEFAATMSVQPVRQQSFEGHVVTVRRKVAALGDARVGPRLRELLAATEAELLAVEPETLAVVVANAPACERLGFSPEALAQMTLPALAPKLDGGALRDLLTRLWRDPDDPVETDAVQVTAAGVERPVRMRMSLWRREAEPFLLVSVQPRAAPRRAGGDAAELFAEHDPVTGLPNRTLLVRRIDEALATQRPFAVAQLALTGIDESATGQGPETTDALVKAIADRLSAVVGKDDTVARTGPDSFALLLYGPALGREARGLLQRQLAIFARPFRAGPAEFQVGATAGLAASPEQQGPAGTLLKYAATALQLARPGEIVAYDERVRSGSDGLAGLREAQAQGDLAIELQPLMDVRARLTAAAELLLSWRFGGRGCLRDSAALRAAGVPPAVLDALPVWLFEQACEQHARWRDLELPVLPLLLNVAAVPVARNDLHELRRLLVRYHVPARDLVLVVQAASLEALILQPDGWLPLARDMGLRIGVDDAAAARPDLLRRVDADVVRLSSATIAGLPAARQSSELSGTGILAGQRIGALVIAEGVERAEQREALLNLGCYLQQGRLLGEPMSSREFSRLLARREVGTF